MKKLYVTIFALVIAVLPLTAKADYFLWQDSKSGLSFTFPDEWQKVNNADPDDLYTVMAPAGRAHVACRVRMRDDARNEIYPVHYSKSVQKISFGEDYMRQYLAEYDDVQILSFMDNASIGRAYASYAVASYQSAVQGPRMHRKAMVFVSGYNDHAYILECSAHNDAFDSYLTMFLSIAKSVDFKKADHELVTGHYRNFLEEAALKFHGDEGKNVVVH